MSNTMKKKIKPKAKLLFSPPDVLAQEQQATHQSLRPKPEPYADRTWAPPRGTRRSMGKR